MAKAGVGAGVEFVAPGLLESIRQELVLLEAMEPGSKSLGEAIAELLPLIRGCRERGHSWSRIAAVFERFVPGLSVGVLRRYAFELAPELKGAVKGVNLSEVAGSVIPALEAGKGEAEGGKRRARGSVVEF